MKKSPVKCAQRVSSWATKCAGGVAFLKCYTISQYLWAFCMKRLLLRKCQSVMIYFNQRIMTCGCGTYQQGGAPLTSPKPQIKKVLLHHFFFSLHSTVSKNWWTDTLQISVPNWASKTKISITIWTCAASPLFVFFPFLFSPLTFIRAEHFQALFQVFSSSVFLSRLANIIGIFQAFFI